MRRSMPRLRRSVAARANAEMLGSRWRPTPLARPYAYLTGNHVAAAEAATACGQELAGTCRQPRQGGAVGSPAQSPPAAAEEELPSAGGHAAAAGYANAEPRGDFDDKAPAFAAASPATPGGPGHSRTRSDPRTFPSVRREPRPLLLPPRRPWLRRCVNIWATDLP
eukprot:COSAG01_NODE_12170_length_1787_cov_1.703199_1_plen_166_part_00